MGTPKPTTRRTTSALSRTTHAVSTTRRSTSATIRHAMGTRPFACRRPIPTPSASTPRITAVRALVATPPSTRYGPSSATRWPCLLLVSYKTKVKKKRKRKKRKSKEVIRDPYYQTCEPNTEFEYLKL